MTDILPWLVIVPLVASNAYLIGRVRNLRDHIQYLEIGLRTLGWSGN